MRRLIASGVIERPSLLRDSLETLDIELVEYRYSKCTADGTPSGHSYETKINVLNDDLAQFAIVAQQSRRLRTLRIQAWSGPTPDYPNFREDFLSLPMIQAFLSLDNLGVLILDLSNEPEQHGDGHICTAIGALLGTLRTLELRMPRICPEVLKPRDPRAILRLSEVVITLSMANADHELEEEPGPHSQRCGSQAGGLLQLQAEMLQQAEILATQMASPKALRIISHSPLDFKEESLDVLTGKTMIWDYSDDTDEEFSEPESEILDVLPSKMINIF